MKLPLLPPLPPLTAGAREDEWGFDPDFAHSVEPWLDSVWPHFDRASFTAPSAPIAHP